MKSFALNYLDSDACSISVCHHRLKYLLVDQDCCRCSVAGYLGRHLVDLIFYVYFPQQLPGDTWSDLKSLRFLLLLINIAELLSTLITIQYAPSYRPNSHSGDSLVLVMQLNLRTI